MHDDPFMKHYESMWNRLVGEKKSENFKEAVKLEKQTHLQKSENILESLSQPQAIKDKEEFLYKIGQIVKSENVRLRLFRDYWLQKKYLVDTKWNLDEEENKVHEERR